MKTRLFITVSTVTRRRKRWRHAVPYCCQGKGVAPSDRMKNSVEIERLLATLTRAEKAELLRWVVQDLGDIYAGIEKTPGICGGAACIVRTRIPVWLLENSRRLETPEAEILRAYPQLRAEDLANAWAYVRSHRNEIDGEIQENEAA